MIPWGATVENSKWRNCSLHSFSLVFVICCILLSGCYQHITGTEFGPTNPHFIAMSTADAVAVIRACYPQSEPSTNKFVGDNRVIYYEEGEIVTMHKDLVSLDTTELTIHTYGDKAVRIRPYQAPATFVPYSYEVTIRFSDVGLILLQAGYVWVDDYGIRPSAEAEQQKGITLFKLASAFVTLSPKAQAVLN